MTHAHHDDTLSMIGWPSRPRFTVRRAGRLAFASDTLSITTMEIVDTLIVIAIPGAMAAGVLDGLFWGSLFVALVIAGLVAFPVNRWLIARGQGHALIH